MRRLSVFEAESEARWRWGSLFTQGVARYTAGARKPFEVGVKRFGAIEIRGRGVSWEAAFKDAADKTNSHRPRKIPIR